MADNDWDVLALYEPEGKQLHQDVNTGRAGYAQAPVRQEMDAGQRMSARRGMGGSDRAAKPKPQAQAQRKMTEAEMMAWAQDKLGDTRMQHQAQVANGPAVHQEQMQPEHVGQAMDDHAVALAAGHKAEMGHPEDDGPGEVPEWLSRYMDDPR